MFVIVVNFVTLQIYHLLLLLIIKCKTKCPCSNYNFFNLELEIHLNMIVTCNNDLKCEVFVLFFPLIILLQEWSENSQMQITDVWLSISFDVEVRFRGKETERVRFIIKRGEYRSTVAKKASLYKVRKIEVDIIEERWYRETLRLAWKWRSEIERIRGQERNRRSKRDRRAYHQKDEEGQRRKERDSCQS